MRSILGVSMVILIIIIGLMFYWYEWRPTNIKRNCSQIEAIQPGLPARPAMNEQELISAGIIKPCDDLLVNIDYDNITPVEQLLIDAYEQCPSRNAAKVAEYSVPFEGTSDQYYMRNATDKEYQQCLRSHGL